MKNKKTIKFILSLALVCALGIGATLAYFTDTDIAENVITMGHVDIDLDEPNWNPDDGEEGIEDVKPGDVIPKDPTITVGEDSADVYVRVLVSFVGLTDEQVSDMMSKNPDGTYKYFDINTRFWREEKAADGYYFYYVHGSGVLTANDSVKLFETVTIPENWGNEIADKTFNINVTADAIQADNFTPGENADGVYGWYNSDGTEITPETYTEPVTEEPTETIE